MEREDGHWTDNPEMIERFVLHKLNPDVLNELEDHLRVCEVCKQAVRAEQIVVAGIRRSGRQRFKEDLRKKLAAEPVEKTPWIQILSAAAVVVILLTVGLYNNWFSVHSPKDNNSVVLNTPQSKEPTQQLDGRTGTEAEKKSESPASRPPESDSVSASKGKESPSPSVASKGTDILHHDAVVDKEMNREAGEAASAAEFGRAKATGIQSATTSDAGLWVEGKILPPGETRSQALSNERRGEVQGYAPNTKKDIRLKSESSQLRRESMLGSMYSVRQQNSIALQPQQQQAQRNTTGIVITRIERAGAAMQLTLYLDSLVDENELTNAIIETPADDSLIVNLSNQRISYRLPSGWNTQMQARPAK